MEEQKYDEIFQSEKPQNIDNIPISDKQKSFQSSINETIQNSTINLKKSKKGSFEKFPTRMTFPTSLSNLFYDIRS